MLYTLECEQEEDGRWLAEVSQLPGVLALRVIAERLENGEQKPVEISISVPAAA